VRNPRLYSGGAASLVSRLVVPRTAKGIRVSSASGASAGTSRTGSADCRAGLVGAAQLGRRDELAEQLPAEQPVVLQVQVRALEAVFA
jgi:hypothetical protein